MTSWKFHAGFWRAAALSFACAPLLCPVSGAAAEHDAAIPKVAVIYTVATPELKEGVERAIREEFGGKVDILRYEDAAVFEETAKAGKVGRESAARFLGHVRRRREVRRRRGFERMFHCGGFGVFHARCRRACGVPIVGINDEMCREAVRSGNRILVAATFPSAVGPTRRSILRAGAELGREVEVSEVVAGGGFGSGAGAFEKLLAEKLRGAAKSADIIVFAQASMEPCAGFVEEALGKRVLTNPKFGAKALKSALPESGE